MGREGMGMASLPTHHASLDQGPRMDGEVSLWHDIPEITLFPRPRWEQLEALKKRRKLSWCTAQCAVFCRSVGPLGSSCKA